jgi:hypothetical protein
MFERYTERARRVIFFARYEASQYGSRTIETEHFLLGLMREDKNVAQRFLQNVAVGNIYDDVVRGLTVLPKISTTLDLPLSEECKHILHHAAEEAERFGHHHITTEHLLLGILREDNSAATQILTKHGLKIEAVRDFLARTGPAEEPPAPVPEQPGGHTFQHVITALQHHPNLPRTGVVPDGDTARRIAEAVWRPLYGAETISAQQPIRVEQKFNIWIISGTSTSDPLFAFILQSDGRILSVGRGPLDS